MTDELTSRELTRLITDTIFDDLYAIFGLHLDVMQLCDRTFVDVDRGVNSVLTAGLRQARIYLR